MYGPSGYDGLNHSSSVLNASADLNEYFLFDTSKLISLKSRYSRLGISAKVKKSSWFNVPENLSLVIVLISLARLGSFHPLIISPFWSITGATTSTLFNLSINTLIVYSLTVISGLLINT